MMRQASGPFSFKIGCPVRADTAILSSRAMTQPDAISSDRTPRIAPLLAWGLIQTAALALAAGRVPLSSRFLQPAEQSAFLVMIVTQALASSLLHPWIMRSGRTGLLAIFMAFIMLELAGLLADVPPGKLLLPLLYIVVWLSLLQWAGVNYRNDTARLFASALAGLLSIGGPLVWYLRAEFVEQSAEINWARMAPAGPIMGALSQIVPDSAAPAAWFFPAGCALLIAAGIFTAYIWRISTFKTRAPMSPAHDESTKST